MRVTLGGVTRATDPILRSAQDDASGRAHALDVTPAAKYSPRSLRPQHLERRPPEHLAAVGQPHRHREQHDRRAEPGERRHRKREAPLEHEPRQRPARRPSRAPGPPPPRAGRATDTRDSTIRKSCARVAPSVRSSAPSRIRWNRLVASAPTSTSVPVASVKSAMNRMASTTRSISRSSVSCSDRQVHGGDVGQPLGDPPLQRPALRRALDPGERDVASAAPSPARRARTRRRSWARTGPSPPRAGWRRGWGAARPARPRRSRRPRRRPARGPGRAPPRSAWVSRAPVSHQRPVDQPLGGDQRVAVGRAVLAAERPSRSAGRASPSCRGSSVSASAISHRAALDRLDPHRHDRHRPERPVACRGERRGVHAWSWSGWMSNSTRLGRAGPPVTRSVRSRLYCTRNSVPSRKAPKPMASTTVAVWLAGRCRLASALPPDVRPAGGKPAARRADEQPTTRPRAPAARPPRRRRRPRPGASSRPAARRARRR